MKRLYFVACAPEGEDPGAPVAEPHAQAGPDVALPPVAAMFCAADGPAHARARQMAAAQGIPARAVLSLTDIGPASAQASGLGAFFERPRDRPEGLERAVDAQYRTLATLRRVVAEVRKLDGDVAVVASRTLGALLRSHLCEAPIGAEHLPPETGSEGAQVLTISLPEWTLLRDWTPMARLAQGGDG